MRKLGLVQRHIQRIDRFLHCLGHQFHLGSNSSGGYETHQKFGQARLRVAVLNPKLVPNLVDVVIEKFVYELQFHVEKEGNGEEPLPIDMDAPFDEADSGAKDNVWQNRLI